MNTEEHQFAQYIRILGKGKRGSRSLTEEEAEEAMGMILRGEVAPIQLGAFLMLLRVKEESSEELAGFVRACRDSLSYSEPLPTVDLDWSSYAGKRRQLPWYLLAALLLAENGVRVFMHGSVGQDEGRIYTEQALTSLGLAPASDLAEASEMLTQGHFAYLPLSSLSPALQQLMELRPLLGLRSPVHTIARLWNPLRAPHQIQAIFHPGYLPLHQRAAQLLEQPNMAVFKGEGGEAERNPDVETKVMSVSRGELVEECWPAMRADRQMKDSDMDVARLGGLWRGEIEDDYASAAVTGTAAIALKLMGRAESISVAQVLASQWWESRDKGRFHMRETFQNQA